MIAAYLVAKLFQSQCPERYVITTVEKSDWEREPSILFPVGSEGSFKRRREQQGKETASQVVTAIIPESSRWDDLVMKS